MAFIPARHPAIAKLLEALGLGGQQVKKVIIAVEADAPVRVFVQKYADEGEVDAMADFVLDESVRQHIETIEANIVLMDGVGNGIAIGTPES
jgi:hypothetical protein